MEETTIYDFGMRMRRLREERGLSRAMLAQKLGVSKQTIYRYENNLQDPSLDRVKQLAVILHTSVDYLVGLDDAYTVKLPNMTDEQRTTLNEFIRVFVTK